MKSNSTRSSSDILSSAQTAVLADQVVNLATAARLASVHSVVGKAMIKQRSATDQGGSFINGYAGV